MAIRDLADILDISCLAVQSISIGSKVDFVDGSLDNHGREETSNDNRELHFCIVGFRGDKDEMQAENTRLYLYFLNPLSFQTEYWQMCMYSAKMNEICYTARTLVYLVCIIESL